MKLGSVAFTAGAAGAGATIAAYESSRNSGLAVVAGCLGAYMALQCYLNARGIKRESEAEIERTQLRKV